MDANHFLPLRFLSHPRSRRWPSVAWAAAWALTAIGLALYLTTYSVSLGPRWGPRGVMAFGALLFTPMGTVIASRRPQNYIGWIYCAIGLLAGATFFMQEYAVFAVLGRPGWLPAGEWAAWIQNWLWVPAAALYLMFIPLLLPEGRLPSPRWRPVAWFFAAVTALLAVSIAVQPGRLQNFYPVINPLGGAGAPEFWTLYGNIGLLLLDLCILAAAASLIWRVRHASAVERQQLKWLAFAFAVGGALISIGALLPALAAPLLLVAVAGMHATTGIAILRYRLYDLDVVINRTVVYGLLTAALAGVYFGSVLVLQGLAVALTGQARSGLVTVLSTLAIAALFNPLRHRIQRTIDRRFFRRKYDAAKALARFGQTIRDDTSGDLEQLNADLIHVVNETLEPASISLWVRPASQKTQP
jgi:hypothetical protein